MKTFRSALITFCFAVAVCLATLTAHAQNIVQNPGFEVGPPLIPGFSSPNWTLTDPNPGVPLSIIGGNPIFANSGNQYAALGTAGLTPMIATLSQSLSTTPGSTYTLSFWLAHDSTTPPPPISNTLRVFFGGVMVQSLTDVGTFGYTQFTFENLFVPTVDGPGGSTLLEFRFFDGNDFFRLDDVSVTLSGVPESGASALLALPAFAGLLLLHSRLRTRKSSVS